MNQAKKLITGAAKGVGKFTGEVISETTKQAGKVAETVVKETVSAGSSPTASQKVPSGKPSQPSADLKKIWENDRKEIEQLKGAINQSTQTKQSLPKGEQPALPTEGASRNVEKEIAEVREKKKKKETEEERFLEELKQQKEKEAQEAESDAQVVLPGSGSGGKKQRGSAFRVQQKQKGTEIRAGKN